MKLYEIDDQIEALLSEHTDRETGEFAPDMEAALAELELARDEKALSVARYAKGLECEADAVALQAKKLKQRSEALQRKAERLLAYLQQYLPEGKKLKDDCVVIGWAKSTEVSVYPEWEANLTGWPEIFLRTKYEPNKARLKAALSDAGDPEHESAAKLATLKKKTTLHIK